MQNNKAAACYKNKVVKNWDAISTIYSTDHANGDGAKTAAESAQDLRNADTSQNPRTGIGYRIRYGYCRIRIPDVSEINTIFK